MGLFLGRMYSGGHACLDGRRGGSWFKPNLSQSGAALNPTSDHQQNPLQPGILISSAFWAAPRTPLQDSGFCHPQDKAHVRQGHFDQEHFQRHDHLVFWSPQVKENGVARFKKGFSQAPHRKIRRFPLCDHIGLNSTNIATVDRPIMGTIRVGAGLAPVLRFSHEPNLRSSGGVISPDRSLAFFFFQSTTEVSTQLRDTQ